MGLLIRIAEMVATPRRVSMSLGLAADRRMTLSEVDQSVIVRVKKNSCPTQDEPERGS
jgi:hypothetical protein